MTTTPPPEPPGGQDGPPDVRTAVAALQVLLEDLAVYLAARKADPGTGELLLRVHAHRSALRRLRVHLETGRP